VLRILDDEDELILGLVESKDVLFNPDDVLAMIEVEVRRDDDEEDAAVELEVVLEMASLDVVVFATPTATGGMMELVPLPTVLLPVAL
jgi:hypothetical protein